MGPQSPRGVAVALPSALLQWAGGLARLPVRPGQPVQAGHGGAEGDSQGVEYFSKVAEKRTEYFRHAVRERLHLQDMRLGAPDPAAYVVRHPAAPHGFLPEDTFNDDRCHFSLTGWGRA